MKTLSSINPFTLEEISSVNELSDEEINQRLELASDTFEKYRQTSFGFRSEKLSRVAGLLRDRKKQYGKLITAEMGKLIGEAEAEVEKCAWVCEYYAEHAEDFLSDKVVATDADNSRVIYQPIGPVLAVMPWNFPFWQVFRFAAPALMAGNVGILKHASNVQGCAEAIAKVISDAGFEPGVFQNLSISSAKVEQVIKNKAVKAVTLTGSEPAGAAVASIAAKEIKKAVLELGGNNAFVVLEDADIDRAVEVAMRARLQNAGQSCIAAKRFILEDGIHDAFLDKLRERVSMLKTGDPMDPDTDLAPLFAEVQADEIKRQVEESISKGAELIAGGKKDRTFYSATILGNVTTGMPVFDEETFGPVFAIIKADSPEHALELSNASEFGLGMQVFTASNQNAKLFVEGAEEGAVFVNGMVKSDPRLPFGGVKRSGFGRELTEDGIMEFVNVKTIWETSLSSD